MNKKIKIPVITLALTALCGCAALGQQASVTEQAEAGAEASGTVESVSKRQLVVFAASSLTETLTEIKGVYEEANKGIEVVYNFDSSGTLARQIEEGAYCDVFISAALKQIDDLEGDDEASSLVAPGSRRNILRNELVLVSDATTDMGIETFDDMKAAMEEHTALLSIGNSDVPAGKYASNLLKYLGIDEEAAAREGAVTYAGNVKEIVTQVQEGAAQIGLVYRTDAVAADIHIIDVATEEMCGEIVYPCCIMKGSNMSEEASAFLEMLTSEEGRKIFEEGGFLL